MRRILVVTAAAVALLGTITGTGHTQQGSIERQVRRTAEALSRAYLEEREILFRINLAIQDFHDDGEAARRQNISQGVEDLCRAAFSHSTVFNLIERQNLDKVLKEQELQLSDLTDPGTAVQIGRIQNAQALLLGTVSEMGDVFLVNLRLVDVETGRSVAENLSLDRREMIEAKHRLDMQYVSAMGVGISAFGFDWTMAGNNASMALGEFGNTVFGRPFGVEFKYRAATWLMFGLGIEAAGGDLHYFDSISCDYDSLVPKTPDPGPFVVYSEGFGLLANVYLVWPVSRRFNVFFNGGVEYLILSFEGYFDPEIEVGELKDSLGNGFGFDEFGPREFGVAPVFRLRAGFEWFVSPRAALSLKLGYDFGSLDLSLTRQWHLTNLPENLEIDLSGFSIGPSLSVYF